MVQKLIIPLRGALTSRDIKIWNNAMDLLKQLAEVTGEYLVPQLHLILASLNSKLSNKNYREKVMEVLSAIESNCGPEALKVMKTKVPTYTSMQ